MTRRSVLSASAMMALGLALLPGGAAAQEKPMKDLIVGTWTLQLDDGVRADGSKQPNFGPNPKGILMFTADGRYSLQIMRDSRPKFASNSRTGGTDAENKAAVQGAVAHFGKYSVNDADKRLTLRIEGSSYPNLDGATQKRQITALTADALTWTNPMPGPASGFVRTEVAWQRVK